MGLPQLETCCGILDLKTGNTVMGCFNAVLSFAMAIVMIVEATQLEVLEKVGEEMNIDDSQAMFAQLRALSIILAIMFFAKFLFDIFFVYGVVMERAGIIKAYFVMWFVFFLLSMFTYSLNVLQYHATTTSTQIFYFGWNVYAILLSHSFYKQLNNREVV